MTKERVFLMADMLINLYELDLKIKDDIEGIVIKRVLAPDRRKVIKFVKDNFNDNFVDECKASLNNNPITCYIAEKDKEIIGFISFEATAKDFVGPMGIKKSERGKGIGKLLMFHCLYSMKEMGYAYAIIGSSSERNIPFHQHISNAQIIQSKTKGIYTRMIGDYGREK